MTKRAVVTGASSGIGAATVRALRESGWEVVAVARRAGRLAALAEETGAVAMPGDVTDQASVDQLVADVLAGGGIDALVNIAGGAFGVDSIAEGKFADWEKMYNVNVLGSLRMIQAFLPALRHNGEGSVVLLTSTAGIVAYEGGGGYVAAKFAQHSMAGTLRLEEAEHNVRVIDILPGLVQTEEFSLNRLGGDQAAADRVYTGVEKPLLAEDVANVVAYSLNLPHHVNLDQVVMRPVAQAAAHKLIRK
ncbi:SDR family oxidoreductase [Arthrobacter sulfonylureivorans]|uniref:SDR family oxidoreductase n=1 Tax=Arthrobacter sulfonylureivorans TaxID=2486855 RepID=A0ABY3WDE4_9MICC|nr:SDR family oxidoreductase [Arthrobacter sulfonylureivorans]UNK47486.1 SDR family oxidoreductase [Arthrobacter sulfonylureivorans]